MPTFMSWVHDLEEASPHPVTHIISFHERFSDDVVRIKEYDDAAEHIDRHNIGIDLLAHLYCLFPQWALGV